MRYVVAFDFNMFVIADGSTGIHVKVITCTDDKRPKNTQHTHTQQRTHQHARTHAGTQTTHAHTHLAMPEISFTSESDIRASTPPISPTDPPPLAPLPPPNPCRSTRPAFLHLLNRESVTSATATDTDRLIVAGSAAAARSSLCVNVHHAATCETCVSIFLRHLEI